MTARVSMWLVGTALLFVSDASMAAQSETAAAGRGLSLADVVQATLARNPSIRIATRQLDADRAGVIAAAAPFETQLQSAAGNSRDDANAFIPSQRGDPSLAGVSTRSTDYTLGISKQLRSGVLVSPQFGLTRITESSAPSLSTNSASVNLLVAMPMLRSRGETATGAGERAARNESVASAANVRHVTASAVLDAVTAYWDYVAAEQRLQVQLATEERAARIIDETRVLVSAQERTPAELKQVQANYSAKRVGRINAEQAVIAARQRLGSVMDLTADAIADLPRATTDFPAVRDDSASASDAATARLATQAIDRRDDVAAADSHLRSAQDLLYSAQNDVLPRVDLVFNVGYAGVERGVGVPRFFAPLYRNVPRLNSGIELRYDAPFTGAAARGRVLQSDAAVAELRIRHDALERQVGAGVRVAAEDMRHSALALREADQGVAFSREAVDNERRRFTMGVSTLFDVLQAEDALTNALLGRVAAQRGYAGAVVTLRFQSGLLLLAPSSPGSSEPRVDIGSLVTPP